MKDQSKLVKKDYVLLYQNDPDVFNIFCSGARKIEYTGDVACRVTRSRGNKLRSDFPKGTNYEVIFPREQITK